MSRWVDVRVCSEDLARAQEAIVAAWAPVDFVIDFHPPASGGEAEISVADRSETDVASLLGSAGISVLASRTRMAASMADQLGLQDGGRER